MATASSTQVSAPAQAAPKKGATEVNVAAPSRREFLYYIWGASMVMLLGQAGAALVWFALPRFKEGEFGGVFHFTGGDMPALNDAPVNIPSGRFWLSNSDKGYFSLYGVCTHLGCLPKWDPVNVRFACPCHGSQYQIDGTWITGPAPRPLDIFPSTITFEDGTVLETGADPNPIDLGGRAVDTVVDLAVDTGKKIKRPNHG
ncbi:MAG TPA: ubiquinol-cytochrome c reductase iron-sulfur subunit [Phototrophicaceae bacterium]|jgi:cytochrome b6-f complex iron-sulfur subunit|nr:ubiquinol-cytochrome c reductase iron-sulfur subunit [Phototrophicaceae bacterium]